MPKPSPIIFLTLDLLCDADRRLELTEPEESVARMVDVEMIESIPV